jgi:hypothetical protein
MQARHTGDDTGTTNNNNNNGLCRPHANCPAHVNDNNGDFDNDNHRVKQTTTIVSPTAPNGLNATFFDANTPYCWYVVNAPPCYDIKTGSIIH